MTSNVQYDWLQTCNYSVKKADYIFFYCNITPLSSVAEPEPEPQGAASFGRSRSRNVMRLRLRQWYKTWLGIES
jgi:hypothetical protein